MVGAANIQLATCSPNFLILEGIERWDGFHAEILRKPIRWSEGYVIPPTEPGLGVELNEAVALQHPYTDSEAASGHGRIPRRLDAHVQWSRSITSSSVPAPQAACSPTDSRAGGQRRVLVLEAGGSDRRFWVRVPIGYGRTFNNPEVNWMYEAEPEPALGGVRSFWPRGKAAGRVRFDQCHGLCARPAQRL